MGDLHLLDALDEVFDDLMKLGVLLALFGDLVVGVQDGRMVTAAEEVADLRQRGVGELAAEVHGNLRGNAMLRVRFLEWRSSMRILK